MAGALRASRPANRSILSPSAEFRQTHSGNITKILGIRGEKAEAALDDLSSQPQVMNAKLRAWFDHISCHLPAMRTEYLTHVSRGQRRVFSPRYSLRGRHRESAGEGQGDPEARSESNVRSRR